MGKQRRAKSITSGSPQSVGRLDRPMKFGGASSGVLDTTTIAKPPTSLESWFADEAAVVAFSIPVKPRG